MTSEQIKLVKDVCLTDDGTGNPKAGVFTVLFNDEISFRNTDDFVIWDDANELIHKITINFDGPVSGAAWPYKISTGFFGNIQFLEGLYNMTNFEKVIDEMFVNTGLIDAAKKEMIMKWANNIRNHAMVPMHPGPYYPHVPHIPPKPPIPEIRPDGIFHCDPIDQRTKKNLIFKKIDEAIAAVTDPVFERVRPAYYKVTILEPEAFATVIKGLIETMGKDLFYASYTDNDVAAIYNPKVQESIDNFETNVVKHVLPQKKKTSKLTTMYIEAYGVRVRYDFCVTYENDDEGDAEWITNTTTSIVNFVEQINNPAIDSVVINDDYSYSAVINTTDGLDIGLTEFLASLPDTSKVVYSANGQSFTLTVGDESTYEIFKEGVISTMPDSNNAATVTGTATVTSNNDVELQYTLKVKYFNESEAVAKIGTQYYSVLANAFAAAQSGQTIELLQDIEVSNDAIDGTSNTPIYVVPDGVTFNGGMHTITAKTAGWVSKGGSYGDNHILGVTAGTATIQNLNLVGHSAMKSGIVVWKGATATIDTVDIKNCGNCGVQAAGGTVSLTNYTSSGNVWGSVNADMSGDVAPSVTFNSGTMSEKVEIYTEITDQEVITAPTLTKYQGFGTQLKGFIYYTSDVTKFTSQGATIYNGAIYETVNDILANNETVELTVSEEIAQPTITVPTGKTLNLNLNGGTIKNVAGEETLVNNGTLTISGTGTIDNTEVNKAALTNNGTLTILGGTISRSQDTGVPDDSTHPGYYTLVNHGTMTIGAKGADNSGITISSTGGYSALVENGWYDSEGKEAGTDDCHLTVYGGTFTGGKYCIKNDELGNVTIKGGSYSNSFDVNVLNWHNLYIEDGTFDATVKNTANVANGKYQKGVGHIEISGGNFTSGASKTNLILVNGYTSSDITLPGGVFNKKTGLSSYLADGYVLDTEINPGKFTVVKEAVVAATVNGVNYETVAAAINSITDNTPTTVTVIGEVTENVTIPTGRNITLSGGAASATINGGVTIQATGTEDTNVTIEHIDLVSPGATKTYGIISQNQTDSGQMNCNLTLDDVSITGFASKAIYGTNIKTLNMNGCVVENCATGTMDDPNTKGDYAVDLNLIAVQDAVVNFTNCTFKGDLGDNAAVKIAQRGGASDAGATDIPKNVGEATVEKVTFNGCIFADSTTEVDFRIGTSNKTPGGDGLNTTGAYAVEITGGADDMTVVSAYKDPAETLVVPTGREATKAADGDIALVPTVDETIQSFIEGLDTEGVTVEADPSVPNTYAITTDGSLGMDTLIDQVVALEGVTGLKITDGTNTAEYMPIGGDLATFKSQVAAMLPTLNEDPEVTLTMTVTVG